MKKEVRVNYQTACYSDPIEVWSVLQNIEHWYLWTDVFGKAKWISGHPWSIGSRFQAELHYPTKVSLDILVLTGKPPHEFVLVAHGDGVTAQQWISLRRELPHGTCIRSEYAFAGSQKHADAAFRRNMKLMCKRFVDALCRKAESMRIGSTSEAVSLSKSPLPRASNMTGP